MKKFFKIIDIGVGTLNQSIAVLGISLGVILAFMNVALRYLFDASFTWAYELTNYLFMWGALFGAAYGFKKGIHISVTILIAKFPAPLAKAMLIFSNMLSFVYLAAMSFFSYQLTVLIAQFGEISVDLHIPMWIPNLVLPLAFGTAAYRAGEKVYETALRDADELIGNDADEFLHDVKLSQPGGES